MLKEWFDINKLLLNENKTTFMVFGGVRANCENKLFLNAVEIERVYETTFLGVILDHTFSWKPQIEYIKEKVSKSIGIIYNVGDLLNNKCLCILYFLLKVPYMSYGVEIWGNTCGTY